MKNRKQKLFIHCCELIKIQVEQAQQAMDLAQQDANNETKSSAGDKYETGRAMAQLDKERHATRKAMALQSLHRLQSIDLSQVSDTISTGSLVTTNTGIYFISIGLGKITLENQTFTVISADSPLGQALLGLEEDEELQFRGKAITIRSIE